MTTEIHKYPIGNWNHITLIKILQNLMEKMPIDAK